MCLNLDIGNTACRTLPRTDTYIIIHIKRDTGNYFSDKLAATLVVQNATHRFRIPSKNMEHPRSSITVCIPSAGISRRRTPKNPVIYTQGTNIAGGRFYCHINPNGDVEPCVFIHYSNANIHDMSLLDALSQPLFKAYQKAQLFNENHLRPCAMLESPESACHPGFPLLLYDHTLYPWASFRNLFDISLSKW